MNEWIITWMNEGMRESVNEWMDDWMNKRMNGCSFVSHLVWELRDRLGINSILSRQIGPQSLIPALAVTFTFINTVAIYITCYTVTHGGGLHDFPLAHQDLRGYMRIIPSGQVGNIRADWLLWVFTRHVIDIMLCIFISHPYISKIHQQNIGIWDENNK